MKIQIFASAFVALILLELWLSAWAFAHFGIKLMYYDVWWGFPYYITAGLVGVAVPIVSAFLISRRFS